MKLQPRYFIGFILFVFILVHPFYVAGFSVVPRLLTNRVNKFLLREEVASLTPEQQKNGWLLEQLESKIVQLKESNLVEPIQVDPKNCWDLLVPEPSQPCMEELENKLQACNKASTVSEWHAQLQNLETFVTYFKHPDSHLFFSLLKEAKKNPLKKFLRVKYVVPTLTALGVISYMIMKRFGFSLPIELWSNSKQEAEMPVYHGPRRRPKNNVSMNPNSEVKLPAKKIIIRNQLTMDHLQKPINSVIRWLAPNLPNPLYPDYLYVDINETRVITIDYINKGSGNEPELRYFINPEIQIQIAEGQDQGEIRVNYAFEWNIPKLAERLGTSIKFVVDKLRSINPKLPLGHSIGEKELAFEVTRDLFEKDEEIEVDLAFGTWDTGEHRKVTNGRPGKVDTGSRNNLFGIEGLRIIRQTIKKQQPDGSDGSIPLFQR